jgi:dipeptidase E
VFRAGFEPRSANRPRTAQANPARPGLGFRQPPGRNNALGQAHSPAIELWLKTTPLAGLFRPTTRNEMEIQIVAMGGGGFSMEPENLLLDQYVLSLARKHPKTKICFLATASGDSDSYIERFYASIGRLDVVPAHLPLFALTIPDIREFLLEQDVIYVGGGNTLNMLLIWRERGIDTILREAAENGTVLCGVSAGSICWFQSGVTDSLVAQAFLPMQCLGWLPGSNCPHYDSEVNRKPVYHDLIEKGVLPSGYATDDGVGLHFVGTRLVRIVSSRIAARAYEVRLIGSELTETELFPRYLGR